jgi:hypothetical protein
VVVTESSRDAADAGTYCRAVEAHLCRKNDGHLIRVSGPAFDMVRGWFDQGIPLKVVESGVDRTFERYHAKSGRRRPLHIAFCEDDVLDAFDAWRRAVGVRVAPTEPHGRAETATVESTRTSRHSLPAHLERLINRLVLCRTHARENTRADDALGTIVIELDGMLATARGARGRAREAILSRLEAMDAGIAALARDEASDAARAAATREAAGQLAPFRERMDDAAYRSALAGAIDRLLRQAAGLPVARFEA